MYSTLRRAAVAMIAAAAVLVGAAPAWGSFGVSSFEVQMRNQDGTVDTQAGSHPYEVTTSYSFNTTTNGEGATVPDGNQRDATIDMPAGFVGNPTAVPTCPRADLGISKCPASSQVGIVTLSVADPIMSIFFGEAVTTGVYNVAAREGEAADLGFQIVSIPVHMEIGLRSESDNGLRVKLTNIPEGLPFSAVKMTLWGVPGEASHTADRGSGFTCIGNPSEPGACYNGGEATGDGAAPFLSLPTSCEGALTSSISTDSWQQTGTAATAQYAGPKLTGCGDMSFAPSIKVSPDSTAPGAPTGLRLAISLPPNANASGSATSALKQAQIVLPEGLVISPSGAAGRTACSDEGLGIGTTRAVNCPSASRIGRVTIETPLLSKPLTGGVYIGQPQSGNPYRLFLVAESPERGVLVRLRASVAADPSTGRLTVSLAEAPQMPMSGVTVELEGGEHALLRNQTICGTATTTAEITPWAAPELAPVKTESSYSVTGQCGAQPFTPKFVSGTVEPQAAGSSPFTFTLSRGAGEQQLGGVSVQLPPGLVGMLSSVTQCPEADAVTGGCPAGSAIGTVSVAAGAGSDPLWVQGGHVYLTGPYEGAPFGLAFVVPAVAGPFNLGTVVVRAALNVNPRTAQVTVSTDALPQILEGVPLELRRIAVSIDRSQFMVNPTSCSGSSVQAAIRSVSGTVSDVSEPYNVANCATLAFKPRLTALALAKTSKKDGASLHVVVRSKQGEANIEKVVVHMPKQLPARLSTLKLACEEAVFTKSPSECAADSRVGTATVYTPVLGVPLSGPVYFVGHGGQRYPEVVAVISGEGVTVQLHGQTHINSRNGITRVTFAGLPDVPISRFDLVLPRGPHSALSAVGNLCSRTLRMPTTITGQNGAERTHVSTVMVSGCGSARHASKRARRGKGGK